MLKFVSSSAVFVAALAGQCSEQESTLWIGNPAFTAQMGTCAILNMGAGPGTTTCLQEAFPGLSGACASCFGQTVECGRDNCTMECIADSFAPECLACTARHGCDAGLATCTGFQTGPPVTPSGPTVAPASGETTDASASTGTTISPGGLAGTGSGAVETSVVFAAVLALAAF